MRLIPILFNSQKYYEYRNEVRCECIKNKNNQGQYKCLVVFFVHSTVEKITDPVISALHGQGANNPNRA